MWAIPNMIPLPPNTIFDMWKAIAPFSFNTTHGPFISIDVRDKALKKRMLESMQIQVRTGGWKTHEIFDQQEARD